MAIFCFLPAQPKKGRVKINSDGRTARFILKNPVESLEGLEPQEFLYEVQKIPTENSDSASEVRSAMIYLFDEEECYNGKPIEYEKLKSTDERLVVSYT